MPVRIVPLLVLMAAALCVGCSDESPESDPGEQQATQTVLIGEPGETPEPLSEGRNGAPVIQPRFWEGEYDGRAVILEAVPVEAGDGSWKYSGAPESEWRIEELEPQGDRLHFMMRFGGRLSGKLVRFEGRFDDDRGVLKGTAFDGAQSRPLSLRRQG